MFLCCDPGLNNAGIGIVDPAKEYEVKETFLIKNARKFTDEEKLVEAVYGARAVKVQAIIAKFKEFIVKYPTIDTIVVEAPFYSALTPMAYGSLLEVIFAIKYEVAIKCNIQFKLIEPLLVKKLFTNKGMASKEAMKQFLKIKQADGSVKLDAVVDELSEHEIDAVAVGFVYYHSTKEQAQQTE